MSTIVDSQEVVSVRVLPARKVKETLHGLVLELDGWVMNDWYRVILPNGDRGVLLRSEFEIEELLNKPQGVDVTTPEKV